MVEIGPIVGDVSTGLGDMIIYSPVLRELKKLGGEIRFYCPNHKELFPENLYDQLIVDYRSGDHKIFHMNYAVSKLREHGIMVLGEGDKRIKPELNRFGKVNDLPRDKKLIVFNADGSGIGGKQYPDIVLLEKIIRNTDATFVQIGRSYNTRLDHPYMIEHRYDPIRHSDYCINRMDNTLEETCSIIESCDLYFGANTGAMHIATAYDKPVLCYQSNSLDILEWGYGWNINLMNEDLEDVGNIVSLLEAL